MTCSRALLVVALGVAFAMLLSTWWVATRTVSPQQAAADAEPPAAQPLTAAVEQRILEDTLVLRGEVVAADSGDIRVGVGERGTSQPVTRVLVESGVVVRAGDPLLELGGRPVLVFTGESPWYRDLRLGDRGEDVRTLQAGLVAAGFDVEIDGLVGPETRAAFGSLLEAHGYDDGLLEPDDAALALEAAMHRRDVAVLDLEQAEDALDRTPAAAREDARRTVLLARASLADALRAYEAARRDSFAIPAAMLAASPPLPGSVVDVAVDLGARPSPEDPVLSIGGADLVVDVGLSRGQAAVVGDGQPVVLLDEQDDAEYDGTVAGLRMREGGGNDRTVATATVAPGHELPRDLLGRNLRVTIRAAGTDAPVLAVPSSALRLAADGELSVLVLRGEAQVRVAVEAGLAAGGWVEIRRADSDLEVGDLVVVG